MIEKQRQVLYVNVEYKMTGKWWQEKKGYEINSEKKTFGTTVNIKIESKKLLQNKTWYNEKLTYLKKKKKDSEK